jgi:hypothetical protein
MSKRNGIRKVKMLLAFSLLFFSASSQIKNISGVVKDKQSDEPIPFASVVFKINGRGALTDSAGRFFLIADNSFLKDTLQVFNVGYKIVSIPFSVIKDSVSIVIKLEIAPPSTEAVVKTKYNRALWFWRKIMSKKPVHERTYWNNFSYEVYNKLELDIKNLNPQKIQKNKLLKPLDFVLDFIDSTSEEKPFLPAYLTETLSDYYHQKDPTRSREIIKAAKADGIDNETVIKQLGGMYQNIDVYSNTIPVFDKKFISPFNDNGDKYYNFKLLDTQYLNQRRLVHFRFTPKHKGEDVFEGDCWVHDSTFSIQKITLRPAVDANINFISGLTLIQEYKLINDSTWFLYKDKFVADISPFGSKKVSLKGRKTTTYKNVVVNDTSVTAKLNEAKKNEQVDVLQNISNLPDSFWLSNRHEQLSKSEKSVYILLDTLEKNPTFVRYRNTLQFISTGVKDIGNYRIGPYYYWISGNPWEGTRMRFDLATNKDFDKHWYFHGYLAYGFNDAQFKGMAEAEYQFSREPYSFIKLTYKNDLDNAQMYTDQLGTDNVFATIFRRPNIPFKFQRSEEKRFEYYSETNSAFGFGITASSKQYEALMNLPGKELYTNSKYGSPFNSFETGVRIRFAYNERAVHENFDKISLGSDYPIVELKYAHAFPGVLQSSYEYDKVNLSISDFINLPPFGNLYYNFYGGKIFGTVPYQFLEIHPGNELFYLNRYAFNLMNRFEYLSDGYAGFNVEHNVGNGLFRFTGLTRKWKFRQFWNIKGVVGNLSDANKQLNFVGNYPYKSLDGKMYMEIGTGIDNIFKLFRIDIVWRLTPSTANSQRNPIGIFGSFRFAF